MADNFGLKIGLEGEKEFKSALASINQQFKVLGSEMAIVEAEFGKNDSSVAGLTARNQVLTKEIEAQKQKVETLRAALDNASASFGENDKRTLNWQIQLNNATATLKTMEKQLEENENAIDEVGKEMDDTAKDTDKLEKELDDAGKEADDAGGKFDKLGSVVKGVGAAMATSFAAIGAATIAAGKALTDMAVDSAAYADEILTQSTVTGMSTDSLQAYAYAADLVDVSIETLTGSMAKNVKSMSNAANGSKLYAEAYDKLGVSITNADGSLRDSETVYWETIDALGQMTNETERDAVAMQLFGKSAQELNPLIAQGSAGIAELTEEAKNAGAVLGGDTLSQLGAFDDSVQRLTQGSEAAKRALGTVLLPQLQGLADDGVSLLNEFTTGMVNAGGDFDKISEVIGTTVGGLVTSLLEQLPKFIQVGMDIVMSIGGAIMDNLPTIIDTASSLIMTLLEGLIAALPSITAGALQLVMALVDGILTNLPLLIDAALQMIVTLATGIAEAIPTLIPAIIQTLVSIVQTLLDNLPMILDAALQLVMGLAQGIVDAIPILLEALPTVITSIFDFIIGAIPQLMEAVVQIFTAVVGMLPELITSIITFLLDSIPMIIETGITLITSLVDALPTIIEAIVAAIPLIIEGIVTAVLEGLPKIIQAGIDLLISLVQALPQIINTIVAAIPDIIIGIVEAVIKAIPQIIQAGIQLFVSLIENLPTIIIEIVKAVPQIITGLITAFTDSIPKIANIGKNIIEGLWEGIKNMGKWIKDKVSDFFGGIVDGVKGLLGIHSPSTVFAGIGENMGAGIGVGFEEAMRGVEEDMQKSIPTEFDVNSSLHGLTPTNEFGGRSFNVTIPLTIDGQTLSRIIAQIQWTQNAVFVRNLGTS